MKFVLEIELGNEAMQTGDDVAGALSRVRERLRERGPLDEDDAGGIMDLNGNRVGKWEVRP